MEDEIRRYLHDPRAIRRIMAAVDKYAYARPAVLAEKPPPPERGWCKNCGKDLPPGKDSCGRSCTQVLLRQAGWTYPPGYPPVTESPKECPQCGRPVFRRWGAVYCTDRCKRLHDKDMAPIRRQQREARKEEAPR